MTTINDLAIKIRDQHGIDSIDAARAAVIAHIEQINDDPDLYNRDTQTLTASGVEVVAEAIAQTYAIGAVRSTARDLLEMIADEEAAAQAARSIADKHTANRDELVRAALRTTELRRADIAAAAGIKEARLYQIRDGRR